MFLLISSPVGVPPPIMKGKLLLAGYILLIMFTVAPTSCLTTSSNSPPSSGWEGMKTEQKHRIVGQENDETLNSIPLFVR